MLKEHGFNCAWCGVLEMLDGTCMVLTCYLPGSVIAVCRHFLKAIGTQQRLSTLAVNLLRVYNNALHAHAGWALMTVHYCVVWVSKTCSSSAHSAMLQLMGACACLR
jgi:hypothetical protein